MSNSKRVWKVFSGLAMIAGSVILVRHPDQGYLFVILILDITLLLYGLRLLIYYFTMARYMVGGLSTLYKSVMVIDFGLFVFGMESVPKKVAMVYLIGCLAFAGVVDLIEAAGARKLEAPSWRFQFFYGALRVIFAIASLFFLDSIQVLTAIYCAGLVTSAVTNIISAFRRTAIVYID